MNKDTSSPAFPVIQECGVDDPVMNGMTLRDYFAAKALQGALTQENFANGFDFFEKAAWSYQQADAMIEARKS